MNTADGLHWNPNDRWINRRQVGVGSTYSQYPTSAKIGAKSVGDAFMPLKAVFSTAC
jgi:hypothetical protein